MINDKNIKTAEWLQKASTQRVFSLMKEGGFEVRVVGGAVRNTLLGLPISDIDFATTALPDDVIALAKAADVQYVPTGLAHGTVSLVIEGEVFELTTLRKDEQTDGRHAVVSFTDDWAIDAARRDFTINALYADADGCLFDPLGGLPDIKNPNIVFIGQADKRISEDYLRILRFFRFYAQYGVGGIDQDGFEACIRGGSGLAQISGERIHVELMKTLVAPRAQEALAYLYDSGLFKEIFSAVPRLSRFKRMIELERMIGRPSDDLLRFAALFIEVEEDIAGLDGRLRLSKRQKQQLNWFVTFIAEDRFSKSGLEALLYFYGKQAVMVYLLRFSLDHYEGLNLDDFVALARYIEMWERPTFPLTGQDLIDQGFEGGVALGETLKRLERLWLESGFALTQQELMALI